jgi:hypothetical protein
VSILKTIRLTGKILQLSWTRCMSLSSMSERTIRNIGTRTFLNSVSEAASRRVYLLTYIREALATVTTASYAALATATCLVVT